ncbi:YIP1 family protein [Natronobiforma cellulositropha]|uniref:YIP1 family protein n=1 Tax=Natronobiforma cellulositropha TaxID=1679076 RepID=UPI0021D57DD1|nr:YIP1 family protein [Natronobiforma cellulositropha]
MTKWIENPEGGRDRGPRAMARAWLEVLVRPGRFFRTGVAPGDQAPGLTFFMAVVLVVETTRYLTEPGVYPALGVRFPLEMLFWLGLVVFLVAPLGLHAVAALQTLCLLLTVDDRAGISQTVQVLAYSSAPCVLAGVAVPELRLLCGIYASALLVYGLSIVHGTSLARAAVAGSIPALFLYGYGFRAVAAATEIAVSLPLAAATP